MWQSKSGAGGAEKGPPTPRHGWCWGSWSYGSEEHPGIKWELGAGWGPSVTPGPWLGTSHITATKDVPAGPAQPRDTPSASDHTPHNSPQATPMFSSPKPPFHGFYASFFLFCPPHPPPDSRK